MTKNAKFKTILETELASLTTELKTIAKRSPNSDDWVAVPVAEDLKTADDNVEADAVEEWNERRASLAQLEIRYRNIKRALEKIANGTFGICEISGEPIEIERLNTNPAARTNLANIDRERELVM
ncbi:hypothetical protein H6785_02710 [Candidatus Nomurabacteria bacterium]|nr:hypothetical protein [Candidatus Nomurabacteria bacterium]